MLYRETRNKLIATGMIDEMVATFEFDETGPLPTIIHQLKYGGMSTLGVELGRCLGKRLQDSLDDPSSCLLVPVPLHTVKLRERGYNQSAFLCKGIAETTDIPIAASLKRTRYTRSQTKLSREERQENVAGAFEVRKDVLFEQKTLILIDDVITTGATTVECARALRNYGAEKILATAIALAP
jgi:ComF family protein